MARSGNRLDTVNGLPAVTWKEFKQAYQDDYLSSLADSAFTIVCATFSHVERILKPKLVKDLAGVAIASWQTKLRTEGMAEATIGIRTRHLKASLRWAHDMELLESVPKIKMPALMQLMRHKDIKTTMQFYVGRDIQDAAEQLWAAHRADAEKSNNSVTEGDFVDLAEEADSL